MRNDTNPQVDGVTTTPEWSCVLGHATKAMECPSCSGSDDPAWWKWYRSRTSSKTVRAGVDAWLRLALPVKGEAYDRS